MQLLNYLPILLETNSKRALFLMKVTVFSHKYLQ